jgi:ribosomal protein L37E
MGCGSPLKAKWLGCPRCLRPRIPGRATGKVAGGFLAKSAGARCGRCGAVSRRIGNKFCTSCGSPMGAVGKAAGMTLRETYLAKMKAPETVSREEQQVLFYKANPDLTPPWGTS